MTDVAEVSPVTAAYLSALRALGWQIGDGEKPPAPAKPPASFYPYAVLTVGTVMVDGSAVHPKEDGLHRLELAYVGRTREGVEVLRDAARRVLLSPSTEIEDHAVVWTDMVNGLPVSRDTSVTPVLFSALDVVNVFVTPRPSGS